MGKNKEILESSRIFIPLIHRFLERRDLLERTDMKQFEIEKNMRQQSKRSHK